MISLWWVRVFTTPTFGLTKGSPPRINVEQRAGCPNKNSHRTQKSDDDDRPLRTTKRHGGSQVVLDARNGRRSSDRSLPRMIDRPVLSLSLLLRVESRLKHGSAILASDRFRNPNSRPDLWKRIRERERASSRSRFLRFQDWRRRVALCERSILSSSHIASHFCRILSLISGYSKHSMWSFYIRKSRSKSIFSFNNYWSKSRSSRIKEKLLVEKINNPVIYSI